METKGRAKCLWLSKGIALWLLRGWEANSCGNTDKYATERTALQLSHVWDTQASAVPELRRRPSFYGCRRGARLVSNGRQSRKSSLWRAWGPGQQNHQGFKHPLLIPHWSPSRDGVAQILSRVHSGHLCPAGQASDLSGLSHLLVMSHSRSSTGQKWPRAPTTNVRIEPVIGDTLIRHRHTACPYPHGELELNDQIYKEEVEKLWYQVAAVWPTGQPLTVQ